MLYILDGKAVSHDEYQNRWKKYNSLY
jgi:hypothetical protein